jgi:hypothetical protein
LIILNKYRNFMKRILLLALFASISFASWAQPANVTGVTTTADDKSITVSWTNSADPFGRVVVLVHQGAAVDASPSGDGSALTATTASPFGTQVGTGNYTVYNVVNGTPATVTITGLTNGTTYHVKVFAKDNVAANTWNTGVAASATPRPNAPTSGAFSSTTCVDQGSITFAAPATGSEYTYLVFAKPLAAITVGSPSDDPTAYGAPTTDMSNTMPAYEDDAAAILVYRGSTVPTSIDLTGLASNSTWTNFHFLIYNVDGTSYSAAHTFTNSRAANTTIGDISNVSLTPLNQSIDISFDFPADCFDEVLVVARSNNAPTSSTPSGTTFTASTDFSSGASSSLNSGKVVYYNGGTPSSTETFTVTNLTNGTDYHFRYFVRKGAVWFVGGSASETPSSAPQITTLDPADNSTISLTTLANAVITFDINVDEGDNGGSAGDNRRTARLIRSSDDVEIDEVDRTSFVFNNNTVTIPFNAALAPNTAYYIRLGGNAVEKATNSTNFGGIGDNTTWNFMTSAVIVTPGSLPANSCYDGDFQTLSTITIAESSNSDFSPGTNLTYYLKLSDGFIFDTTPGTGTTSVSGGNISGAQNPTYLSDNILKIAYTISGTNALDQIQISGLKIKYTAFAPATGTIVRIDGTGVQAGNEVSDGKIHANLSATNSSTPVTFTVQALSGKPPVNANKTNYNETDNGVTLVGSPTGGTFDGNGVALTASDGYTFTPSAAQQGAHAITYIVRESTGQHCMVTTTKTFFVASNNIIQNLDNSYCRNDAQSNAMSVTPAQINSDFYDPLNPTETYTFLDFVFNDNPDVCTINIGFFILRYHCTYQNWQPIGTNVFNPAAAQYGPVLDNWGVLEFSYRVKRTSDNAILQSPSIQQVVVYNPPTPNFTTSAGTDVSFCDGEAPIQLLGSPAPSSILANDFFTGSQGVSNVGGNQWEFDPDAVNVSGGPAVVNVTYTYRDPSTGCTATSSPVALTTYPNPAALQASDIDHYSYTTYTYSPGTIMEICVNEPVGHFITPGTAEKYRWYSGTPVTTANFILENYYIFPTLSNSSPGTANYYVTQIINGCESAPLQTTFTVKPVPSAPGSNFTREYCKDDVIPATDYTLTGTNVNWYNFPTGTLQRANDNNPTGAELGISTATANKFEFRATQTVNGCESVATEVVAIVKALPIVTIVTDAKDESHICKTDDIISYAAKVDGSPATDGQWTGSGTVGLINTTTFGTTQLNPALPAPGTYGLTYTYEDNASNCSNTASTIFTIMPTINPDIEVGDACDGFFVNFVNESQVVPSGGATISTVQWEFGDGTLDPAAFNAAIPVGTHGGETKGTYDNLEHRFEEPDQYTVKVTMTTSDGCVVVANENMEVFNTPVADFAWQNVCYDVATGADVLFTGTTTNGINAEVASGGWTWNFSKHNNLIVNSSGSGRIANTEYGSVGKDTVTLFINTQHNCKDTVSKVVYIVPKYPTITETTSYTQSFDVDQDSWLEGGVNSSWAHGVPTVEGITMDGSSNASGKAWKTNLNGAPNAAEHSFVLSRCFDLTSTTKPVFAMDVRVESTRGSDGAVLQYNTSGIIDDDSKWKVVGTINQGINWYDQLGIAGKPGNQATNDVGWTGENDSEWKRAIFKLDDLLDDPDLNSTTVFRIAFASVSGTGEGFAFDNVFIGERSRIVLLESFTNDGAVGASAHDQQFTDFEDASNEVVKIEYHTSFPEADPINDSNAPMNDARTAFYGISNAPTYRIDGQYRATAPATWLASLYDNRLLTPSPVKIEVDPLVVATDGSVPVKIKITNTTALPLPLDDVQVFVVLVEKTLGTSRFVAKDFLPSPSGIKLSGTIAPGAAAAITKLVPWSKNMFANNAEASIAIVVQSAQGNKEVHQAKVVDVGAAIPDLVTDAEDHLASTVKIYPNPADKELTIVLNGKAANPINLKFIDSFGREVQQSIIQRGKQEATLSTTDFAAGVYMLQLQTTKGVVRKKVMVVHE